MVVLYGFNFHFFLKCIFCIFNWCACLIYKNTVDFIVLYSKTLFNSFITLSNIFVTATVITVGLYD